MSGVDLTRHYGDDGLAGSLEEVLASAGLGEELLSPVDLAAIDQFHTRGLVATAELAEVARIQPDDLVLDIGSGVGGPSRYLAAQYGCRVSGIDLSPSFVAAARFLAKRTGLLGKVSAAT
jgi:SAM-dependent methyltransferase